VLLRKIEASFGKLDACKKELATAATTQFGSGWPGSCWTGQLKVVKTAMRMAADHWHRPLLTLDVWNTPTT